MLTGAQSIVTVEAEPKVGLRLHADPSGEEDAIIEPRRKSYVAIKRMLEWTMAMSLLLLSAPMVLVLAILVKVTSRGPAVYAQTRLGKGGRMYRIFKLRTMVHNAEAATGPVWAARDDCRVTSLGRFLRRTHLDELPQLVNVVRGEMALIGPRPERPEIAAQIERELPEYCRRLVVFPGITGLAQMLVPADDPDLPIALNARRKLAHDMYYVREMNLGLDARIAVATACFFLGAAIDAVHRRVMWSHGKEVARMLGDNGQKNETSHIVRLVRGEA